MNNMDINGVINVYLKGNLWIMGMTSVILGNYFNNIF